MVMVPFSSDVKQEYQDFKDNKGDKGSDVTGQQLKRLLGTIHTLPVSTVECERGFSKINVIMLIVMFITHTTHNNLQPS